MPAAINRHATCLLVHDRCVLIQGRSGSGKTTLAVQILSLVKSAGGYASLVSDDQVWLEPAAGRLLARTPLEIAGRIEIRGVALKSIGYAPSAVVDLIAELSPAASLDRLPETTTLTVLGVPVRYVKVLEKSGYPAVLSILAALDLPPFG